MVRVIYPLRQVRVLPAGVLQPFGLRAALAGGLRMPQASQPSGCRHDRIQCPAAPSPTPD
eukprot:2106930-Prymnesium_polylepis.1